MTWRSRSPARLTPAPAISMVAANAPKMTGNGNSAAARENFAAK